MIQISKLTVQFPGKLAVDNASVKFENGQIYGLTGPNGAGKSSLIKAMVGLISDYDGEIKFDNLRQKEDRLKIKSLLGYGPEDPELFLYLTGREFLQMIADIRKVNAPEHISFLVSELGLDEMIDDIIAHYSHGMRQKISFAAAIIGKPAWLILDEAINGFDPVSLVRARNILKDLAKAGTTVIIASHILEMITQWCDQIIIMDKGRILAGYSRAQIEQIVRETGKSFADHFLSLILTTAS